MRESCTSGSVRGARGNSRPYRNRRDFLTSIAAVAVTAPDLSQAQQSFQTIGYVSSRSAQADAHLVAAFRSGLREIGYLEGQNVEGLVSSFNRPGGDTTGIYVFTVGLGPKRLEILRELVPSAAIIAVLVNPKSASTEFQLKDVQDAARAIGQQIEIFAANSESELNVAFDKMARSKVGALLVGADPFFQVRRSQLIDLALRHRIPTVYEWADFVASGGLASYSTSRSEAYRLAGTYAGRVLKGEQPSDLPVVQSSKFELAINLKTAKALGLTVPPTLLALADEVIE
jgi:putative tryptophan/tyrosine transport system substrate-binding protein